MRYMYVLAEGGIGDASSDQDRATPATDKVKYFQSSQP